MWLFVDRQIPSSCVSGNNRTRPQDVQWLKQGSFLPKVKTLVVNVSQVVSVLEPNQRISTPLSQQKKIASLILSYLLQNSYLLSARCQANEFHLNFFWCGVNDSMAINMFLSLLSSQLLEVVRWGFKGENYGRGRWTQKQLCTGGKDKEEQKASFNKAKAEMQKNQGRQNRTKSKVTTESAR